MAEFQPPEGLRPDPRFEDLLASPHLQFDDGELLPHLLAFGPPRPSRPWLFENVPSATVAPEPVSSTGEESSDER